MKYRHNIRSFVSFALCLLLFACSRTKYDFINLPSVEKTQFKELGIDNFAINKKLYTIPLPPNAAITELILHNNMVYYVVDYANNFVDQTGTKPMPKFTKDYQTEIRAYDLLLKKDTLIYKPADIDYKAIEHLGVNGQYLFFVDYTQSNITHNADHRLWHLNLLNLQTKEKQEILPDLAAKYGEHRLLIKLIKQELQMEIISINESPVHLRYDLVTGKLENCLELVNQCAYEDKVKLNYQHTGIKKITDTNKINYLFATSEFNFTYKNKQEKQVALPLKVEYVKLNEQYCLCQEKDKRDIEFFVLDHQNMQLMCLLNKKAQGYFRYLCLEGKYILAFCTEGLFLYDLENRLRAKLNTDIYWNIIYKTPKQRYYSWNRRDNELKLEVLSFS